MASILSLLAVMFGFLVCSIATSLEPQASHSLLKVCACQEKPCVNEEQLSPILYHQLMTPLWIQTHASYLHPLHTVNSDFLTFDKPTTVENPVLVQIPILPEGKVPDITPLSVELKISLDPKIGAVADSDIKFTLCDKEWCYGIFTVDKGNYPTHAPCGGLLGKVVNNAFTNEVWSPYKHDSSKLPYPSEFVVQFKLQERWVSCFVPVAGGFFKTAVVAQQLKPSQGLTLVVSKSNKAEKVAIAMMKITVMKEN